MRQLKEQRRLAKCLLTPDEEVTLAQRIREGDPALRGIGGQAVPEPGTFAGRLD